MTPERLAEIEARARAATEGPWMGCKGGNCQCGYIFSKDGVGYVAQAIGAKNVDELGCPDPHPTEEQRKRNSLFLISARQDIPDLISYLQELKSELKIDWQTWALDMCSLLDRIELASDDEQAVRDLCAGRFDMAREHGLEVEIQGETTGMDQ